MKLVATMPVRNEDWCLWLTLPHVLTWCDAVVVQLHACTDRSRDIVLEAEHHEPERVIVMEQPEPVWREASHRQAMLERARREGATHIALVDGDELLSHNLLPLIRDIVAYGPEGSILQLPWVCLARGISKYYTSGPWFNNWVTTAFKDSSTSCWVAPNGYDFHHRHPFGRPSRFDRPVPQQAGGLLHLQFISERRLKAKQALYKLTERLRWPDRERIDVVNQRYNTAVYQSDPSKCVLSDVPDNWWADPLAAKRLLSTIHDEPWQERECRNIVKGNLGIAAGLDLFGVV